MIYQGISTIFCILKFTLFHHSTTGLLSTKRRINHVYTKSTLSTHLKNKLITNIQNLYPQDNLEPDVPKPNRFQETLLQPPITETMGHTPSSPPTNPKPKILVLGASGKIGRLVIRNLMLHASKDTKIVAFVRDYDKACDVLYDDLIIEHDEKGKGPKLELVVGNLVHPQEVYGYTENVDEDDDDDEEYAVSASRFYGNDISEYDFRDKNGKSKADNVYLDPNFILKSAVHNSTVIINTIGTIRPTLPFADYLLKPWRVFTNPSKWCKDPRHPYYVNYLVMKKVLQYAESEQKSREEEWTRYWQGKELETVDESKQHSDPNKSDEEQIAVERPKLQRIRIIRISDLCVASPAWDFVTVLTNIFRSLVFRDQERCEKLLESSKLVDSIILRPGDLKDEERNTTSTSLQVDISGVLALPAYVGRDDVASLATVAALSSMEQDPNDKEVSLRTKSKTSKKKNKHGNNHNKDSISHSVRHWTIAVRWAGRHISQGFMSDGHNTAQECMKQIVKQQAKQETMERRYRKLQESSFFSRTFVIPFQNRRRELEKRRIKPYGLFVLLPMLLVVYPTILSMMYSLGMKIPIVKSATSWIILHMQPFISLLVKYFHLSLKKLKQLETIRR